MPKRKHSESGGSETHSSVFFFLKRHFCSNTNYGEIRSREQLRKSLLYRGMSQWRAMATHLNLSHKLSLWHIDTSQLECVHWQHVLGRRFVLRSQMEKVISNSVLSGPLPSCPVTQLFLSHSIYVPPGTGRQQVSHMLWLDYSFHLPQEHDTLWRSYPAGC